VKTFFKTNTTPDSSVLPDGHSPKPGNNQHMFFGSLGFPSILQKVQEILNDKLEDQRLLGSFGPENILSDIEPGERHTTNSRTLDLPLGKPTEKETEHLILWYQYTTNGLLDLFDGTELQQGAIRWSQRSSGTENLADATYYLACAIGAQASPKGFDVNAESYFDYGRKLLVFESMDKPSLYATQLYTMITMYLVGAGRWNGAFMSLGMAIRGAYALDVHRFDISALFEFSEQHARERLWHAIRVLDLFLSLILGRPLSTCETREPSISANYSASADLCTICESVYIDAHAHQPCSKKKLEHISKLYRQWTKKYISGPTTDKTQPMVSPAGDNTAKHDLGLYLMKQAFFVSIMVWTQSSIFTMVSQESHDASSNSSESVLADACVISAIRCIDLLHELMSAAQLPRRLPFVVNHVFISALVLGVSILRDIDLILPVQEYLRVAQELLSRFHLHDTVASKYYIVIRQLGDACYAYTKQRSQRKVDQQNRLFTEVFGGLSDTPTVQDKYEYGQIPMNVSQTPWLDLAVQTQNSRQASLPSPCDGEFYPHELIAELSALGNGYNEASPQGVLSEWQEIDSLFDYLTGLQAGPSFEI
jgi:hypothetical protein